MRIFKSNVGVAAILFLLMENSRRRRFRLSKSESKNAQSGVWRKKVYIASEEILSYEMRRNIEF